MQNLQKRQFNLKQYNSKQERAKRIAKSRHANECKERKRIEAHKDELVRVAPKTVLNLVFENPLTGKIHFIQFHYIGKKATFKVTDNGKLWMIGSYTTVFKKLKQRCPRITFI